MAAPPAADVSSGNLPLPHAYRIDAPEEDAAYAPVALTELTADPERYDGQLVRVVGTFRRWPMGLTPECLPARDAEADTAVPLTSSGSVGGGWGITDDGAAIAVYPWRRDELLLLGSQDTNVSYADGQALELRGLIRAVPDDGRCAPSEGPTPDGEPVVLLVRRAELTFGAATFAGDRVGPPPAPPRPR